MRIASLKYDLLAALHTAYKTDPARLVDITPIMHDHGVYATTSMLEYGKALKSSGLLKEYTGGIDTFMARISIQGINQVSVDVKKEVYQLLNGLKADPHHYYPVKNHLEYLPQHYQSAVDIAHFLNANALAHIRIEEADAFIQITERGLQIITDPLDDPSEDSLRLIA